MPVMCGPELADAAKKLRVEAGKAPIPLILLTARFLLFIFCILFVVNCTVVTHIDSITTNSLNDVLSRGAAVACYSKPLSPTNFEEICTRYMYENTIGARGGSEEWVVLGLNWIEINNIVIVI